jgi:hypothetical protein
MEVLLRYFRYTKEEIDGMSDMDALRRYYIALRLMEAMSGGGGGGTHGSYTPDRPSPPASSTPRRRSAGGSSDSYSFPGG